MLIFNTVMFNHERASARRLEPPRWGRVNDLLYAVTKTPEYQKIIDEVRSQRAERQPAQKSNTEEWGVHLIENLPSVLRRKAVIVMAAQALSERLGRTRKYESDQTRQLALMAATPNWLLAKRQLDQHGKMMERPEKKKLLGPIITFNHALRKIIDAEQCSRMQQLTDFVGGVALTMGKSEEIARYAENAAQITLVGMRQEIAAESALSSMREVHGIRGANDEEELDGIDIVVNYNGVKVGIDIKSSQAAADEANAIARKHRDAKYMAVWSGFTGRDFGDKLILENWQLGNQQGYYRSVMDAVIQQVGYNVA